MKGDYIQGILYFISADYRIPHCPFHCSSDASNPELTENLRKMTAQRIFWKDQDILRTF